MKTFAFLTVLLVACGPEPSFPVRPPAAQKLAALAGKEAIDCGTAVDRDSADRVYECAATALARRRPFYCRYSPPRESTSRRRESAVSGLGQPHSHNVSVEVRDAKATVR
jgi:hypothetical protein